MEKMAASRSAGASTLPFIGTSAAAAAQAFDKYTAAVATTELGFAALPICLIEVKSARAGSSVGVKVASGMKDAIAHAHWSLRKEIDIRVVVERYAHGGREFTAVIELLAVDGSSDEVSIFNYRKYLSTQQDKVRYHTPPRFIAEETAAIRQCASRLFAVLGLRDVARMDGWLLPSTTHTIGGDIGCTSSGTSDHGREAAAQPGRAAGAMRAED
eukprot:jgi/Chlat1/1471/Chrsp12S00108